MRELSNDAVVWCGGEDFWWYFDIQKPRKVKKNDAQPIGKKIPTNSV